MSAVLVYQPSEAVTQLRCQRIPILNDSVLENTESFSIRITTFDTSVVLTQSRVPVYIQDDDGVRVSLERREYSIREEEGALTVCTTLDGAIEREIQMMLNLVPITAQGEPNTVRVYCPLAEKSLTYLVAGRHRHVGHTPAVQSKNTEKCLTYSTYFTCNS